MITTFKVVGTFVCTFIALPAQQSALSTQDSRYTQASYSSLSSFTESEDHEYVPIAERERNRAATPIRTIAPQEQPFIPAGTVSVKALQNPLSNKARKLIEKAEGQIRAQNYSAATKTLDSARMLEDARPYALALSGSLKLSDYIRHKDPKILSVSVAELLEAVQQIPEDAAAHSNLGLALYFAGDAERALAETTKALQMDPAKARSRYVMGLILVSQRRYAEAAFHLKTAALEIGAANELLIKTEGLAAASASLAPAIAQK